MGQIPQAPVEGRQDNIASEGGLVDLGQPKGMGRLLALISGAVTLVFLVIIGVSVAKGPSVSTDQVGQLYQNFFNLKWVGMVNPESVKVQSGDEYQSNLGSTEGCAENLSGVYGGAEGAITAEVLADKKDTTAVAATTVYADRSAAIKAYNQANESIKEGCAAHVDEEFTLKSRGRGWALGAGYTRNTLHHPNGDYLGELMLVRTGNTLTEVFIDYPNPATADFLQPFWLALDIKMDLAKVSGK